MSDIPKFLFALREDLINEKQFLPTRAEPKATGWDVRAAFLDRKPLILRPFQKAMIPLGIRGFCPDGWWYELKPRSSSFAKKSLHALYGTIDEAYAGQLIFACQFIPQSNGLDWDTYNTSFLQIDFGEAIGQIIPRLRQEMEVVEVTNEEYDTDCKNRAAVRGDGGFGSTSR